MAAGGSADVRSLGLPVVDHHAHLRPDAASMEAVRRFESLGGTHIFLATQNYAETVPLSLEDYRAQFETTLSIVRSIEQQTTVRAFPVLAPYPIDLLGAADQIGLARAVEVQKAAIELAGRYIREHAAVAIGEVGRAHFPVPPEREGALTEVLEHAMQVGREVGCPLVLHTEDLDGAGYERLAKMAARLSLEPSRLVKHYARAFVPAPLRHSIVPSFLARKDLVKESLADPGPWFWETDYLADPSRPGAVLSLETVPRRVAGLLRLEAPAALSERLSIPFREAPRKVYGIELQPREGP